MIVKLKFIYTLLKYGRSTGIAVPIILLSGNARTGIFDHRKDGFKQNNACLIVEGENVQLLVSHFRDNRHGIETNSGRKQGQEHSINQTYINRRVNNKICDRARHHA